MIERTESKLIPVLLEAQGELAHATASATNPHFKSSTFHLRHCGITRKNSLMARAF